MNRNGQTPNGKSPYSYVRKDARNSRTEPPANLQFDGTRDLDVVKIPGSSGVFTDNNTLGDSGQSPVRLNLNLNRSNASIAKSLTAKHFKFKNTGSNAAINISVPKSQRSHTNAIPKYSFHNKEQSH